MTRLQTRDQLLNWLHREFLRLNRRSLVRTMEEGQIELLGGFALDPPGWIVRILSDNGGMWNVAVVASDGRYGLREIKGVPWHLWTGGKAPLYLGDNPDRYLYYKRSKERLNAKSKRLVAFKRSRPVLLPSDRVSPADCHDDQELDQDG